MDSGNGKVSSASGTNNGTDTHIIRLNRKERSDCTSTRGQSAGEEAVGKGREIVEHRNALENLAFLESTLALAGTHQHRPRRKLARHHDVALGIANGIHAVQVGLEPFGNFLETAGTRLAALAAVIGAVRAEKDGIDFAALGTHGFEHFGVDAPERVHIEQPACYA